MPAAAPLCGHAAPASTRSRAQQRARTRGFTQFRTSSHSNPGGLYATAPLPLFSVRRKAWSYAVHAQPTQTNPAANAGSRRMNKMRSKCVAHACVYVLCACVRDRLLRLDCSARRQRTTSDMRCRCWRWRFIRIAVVRRYNKHFQCGTPRQAASCVRVLFMAYCSQFARDNRESASDCVNIDAHGWPEWATTARRCGQVQGCDYGNYGNDSVRHFVACVQWLALVIL